MKERRLAFLLGDDLTQHKNRNNQSEHVSSQKNLSRCMSASGVNKKIQNKIRTESKERPLSSTGNKSTIADAQYKHSASSSGSMYDSAEIVASALGKSRNQNVYSSNVKSNSSFCLQRQSSELGSVLNKSYDGVVPNVSKSRKGIHNNNLNNDR